MKAACVSAIFVLSMIAAGCEDAAEDATFNGSEAGTNAGATGDVTGTPAATPGETDSGPVFPSESDKSE